MGPGQFSPLLEFSNTLVALAAAVIYYRYKPQDLSGHPFFSAQRWAMPQAVLFFLALDLAYKAASPLLAMPGSRLAELAAWLAFQLVGPIWLALFFLAIRQPVHSAGLASPPVAGILHALRWAFGVLLAIAVSGTMAPPETVARVFHMERHTAGWVYFAMLVAAASFAGLVEEVGYRGILYGAVRKRMSPLAAMVLTSACFMLAHGEVNPLAFGMGLLCARMVEKYHSVLPGMILPRHNADLEDIDGAGQISRPRGEMLKTPITAMMHSTDSKARSP